MDFYSSSNWNDCSTITIPHGRLSRIFCSGDFPTTCQYWCLTGYERPSFIYRVFCSASSGRWETLTGEQPCIARKRTTNRPFITGTIPPYTRRQMQPTTYMPDFSFKFTSPYVTTTDPISTESGIRSAAIFGIIFGGVIGFVLLLVCFWTCLLKCLNARKRAKTRTRAIRNLVILHNAYSPPPQRRLQTTGHTTPQSTEPDVNLTSSSNNLESGNTLSARNGNTNEDLPSGRENSAAENGLIFLYIRRFIPIFQQPVPPAQHPPEPPPYDAESAAPPPYEEDDTQNTSIQEPHSEPPPPYSEA